MRNKLFSYRLLGWLLLAGLAAALPSSAEDIKGKCLKGKSSSNFCVGSRKGVEVTFKASLTTPACNVTVPSEILLPDTTVANFLSDTNGLGPNSGDVGADRIWSDEFKVTVLDCDEYVQISGGSSTGPSTDLFLRLKFTDLGNTSSQAGIFATDYPPRDDVGFVIMFKFDHSNVLLRDPSHTSEPGISYYFKARMQKYSNYTGSIAPGPVSGSVSVVAEYE